MCYGFMTYHDSACVIGKGTHAPSVYNSTVLFVFRKYLFYLTFKVFLIESTFIFYISLFFFIWGRVVHCNKLIVELSDIGLYLVKRLACWGNVNENHCIVLCQRSIVDHLVINSSIVPAYLDLTHAFHIPLSCSKYVMLLVQPPHYQWQD